MGDQGGKRARRRPHAVITASAPADAPQSPYCRVCGRTNLVRSHLLPRAFAHDARKDQKHLLVGKLGRKGYSHTQAGDFDDRILCREHEAALQRIDDYGVSFVRGWRRAARRIAPNVFALDGVNSDLLVQFAASVVWRHGVSSRYPRVMLGVAEKRFQDFVFHDASAAQPLLLVTTFQADMLSLEQLDVIALPVSPSKFAGRRGYGFMVGGLLFNVLADGHYFEVQERGLFVNGESSFMVAAKPFSGSPEFEGIKELLVGMGEPPSR